ncbi:UNVERIFIED_CONTAM: hypothetical protein K2H54_046553 [Gekko kuhli]
MMDVLTTLVQGAPPAEPDPAATTNYWQLAGFSVDEAGALPSLSLLEVARSLLAVPRKIPPEKPELEVDCSFGQGTCAWQQDASDDFDWNPADHDNGDGYYMAVPAFIGHKKDVGRLKLLLTDLNPKGIYCLIFSYRLAGDRVGKLQVIVGNNSHTPSWEQSLADDEQWKTGQMEVFVGDESSMNITFEAERGKGKTGEIGVDNVILVSGLCPEDHLTLAV